MKLKDLFESTGKSVADLGIEYDDGDFMCNAIGLKSLEGSPEHVTGRFECIHNQLTSLDGCPRRIDDAFVCYGNKILSLVGGPEFVGGKYLCGDNALTTLKGAPGVINDSFVCALNKLRSLAGGPSIVHGLYRCSRNKIKSFKDVHKHVKEINGGFVAYDNPIESHVLGLLLISGLKRIILADDDYVGDLTLVEEILNRHLGKGRVGMLQAQEELMEAGLEEFAQL